MTRPSTKAGLTLWGIILFLSPGALAQNPNASISGVVEDESGAVIPGANVSVVNAGTGISRSTASDNAGRYHVSGLIPGPYEIQAQAAGFETGIRRGIQLVVGSEAVVNLTLRVGQVTQTTVVTAEAPIVETATSTLTGLVDDKTMRDLPLNGRSFDQLISLQSSAPTYRLVGGGASGGTSQVFSINGARTQSNLFLMDGIELVGAGSITTLPGGALGKNMGVEAVREFKVLSSNYSAAYGKKAGGIINIATRSGTNQLHGAAFEFHRNDNLDARNFFDDRPSPPEFKRNQFGGAMGGPIRRDQTFFFGNYEGLRERLGKSNIAFVPDANARQGLLPDPQNPGQFLNVGVAPAVKPFLDLFPAVNGRNFGDGTGESFSSPTKSSRQDFFLSRFDHQLSDKDFLFGRYNFSDSGLVDPNDNPVFSSVIDSRDQIATVEAQRVLSADALHSIRFGFTRGRTVNDSFPSIPLDLPRFFEGAKQVGEIRFSSSGLVAGVTRAGARGAQSGQRFVVNQFEVADQVSYHRGPHALEFGAKIQRIQHNDTRGSNPNGLFQFPSLAAFLRGEPSRFQAPAPGGDPAKALRQIYFASYVQDDFKLLPNLTLNVGLRYELMSVPVEASGNRISNFRSQFADGFRVVQTEPFLGEPFFKPNHNNFAPRIGFAWDPFSDGKMSVRGGFGIFYDQVDSDFRFFTDSNAPFFGLQEVSGGPFPLGFSGSVGQAGQPNPDSIDFNLKVPTRLQYNFSIQRQLTPNTVVNIGYVGSHSYHLSRQSDFNTRRPEILPDGTKVFSSTAPRINPSLNAGRFITYDGHSFYNALQLDVLQRLSHGLRYKVSYTLSKNIDEASSLASAQSFSNPNQGQDPYNRLGDRGLSAFDVRQNLVANFTYNLPWNNQTGLVGRLIGGWQPGAIITASSGPPVTVLTGFNRSRSGADTIADRPNLRPGADSNPRVGGPDRYFDPGVFELAPAGFFGNTGRNTLIGPGLATVDLSLLKRTPVSERLNVESRFEAFNLVNRANFGRPNNAVFQSNGQILGNVGRISATVTSSRQLQFGLKFLF